MPDCKLITGDCLEVMKEMEDESVDAIITDLPYGTTSNRWDAVIPFDLMWAISYRVMKPNSVFVTTASQPFTSRLVVSNIEQFRHEWIWIKNRGSNFANTVREPMKEHESVLVFSRGKWTYNKQMQERSGSGLSRVQHNFNFRSKSENYREFEGRENQELPDLRVPSSWQKFNTETGEHPTQKPVSLFEYLVLTYTNPGDTVLDICCGSGTTGVACMRTGRHFVGIELDENYIQIAKRRIEAETRQPTLFEV